MSLTCLTFKWFFKTFEFKWPHITYSGLFFVCACVFMRVWVGVCVREGEREREKGTRPVTLKITNGLCNQVVLWVFGEGERVSVCVCNVCDQLKEKSNVI